MSEAFINVWVLVRVVISVVRRQLVHVALELRQTRERQQAGGRLRKWLAAGSRSAHTLVGGSTCHLGMGAHATARLSACTMPASAAGLERIPPLPQPTLHLLKPLATASCCNPKAEPHPRHLQPSGAVIRHPSPGRRLGRKARLAAQGRQVQLNHVDALVRLRHNDVHLWVGRSVVAELERDCGVRP